jgi:hypothetical protein
MVIKPQEDVVAGVDQPASKQVKPIFIVGVPRSGTTLLVNLIGLHPQLAPIFETRFLRNLLQHCEYTSWYWNTARSRRVLSLLPETLLRSRFTARCAAYKAKIISFHSSRDFSTGRQNGLPFERQIVLYTVDELIEETDRWIGNLLAGPVPEAQVYSQARQLVSTLFSLHCARMDKPHWVNKTPGLLTEIRHLPKLFPDAKCLHILRDGREVALSMLATPWGPKTVVEAARRWKRLLLEGRRRVDGEPLDYRELRYEELISAPQSVLLSVFGFLELNVDLQKILSRIRVYPDSIGKWKTQWARRERKAFADEAGDMLIEMGYEKDYAWVDSTDSASRSAHHPASPSAS